MVRTLRAAAVTLAATLAVVSASQASCGADNLCPESTPCCSEYGQCGVGAYCLIGCDPLYSYSLGSCMPAPACSSTDYKMTSLDDIMSNTEYLGDASKANWVSSGTPVAYNDDSVLLTMAANTVGTLLSSTRYVWYGKISATMTTSQGAGVVTAFIMMSDVKDEIDFEFVGVDLAHAQSNFYFQGELNYHNSQNLTVSNTRENLHTYTFDWQPDYISWAIDGTVLRTKYRNETYNSTTGEYEFPQTPAKIQLSLWPAGLSSNAQGTIDWSGGVIDWNSPYMQNGYYYAMVTDVNVECYSPPSGYNNSGSSSYVYNGMAGTNNTVAVTNENTILASFYATGEDEDLNPNASASASASGTKTAASAANTSAATVPGVAGAGGRSGTDSDSSDSSASGSTTSTAASSTSTAGGFSQGLSASSDGTRVVAGSLIALVGFFVAALTL